MKEIRFPLISKKEFVSVVFDSYILSFQEVGDMMKHYSNVLSTPLPYKQIPRLVCKYILRFSRFKKFTPAGTPIGWWSYTSTFADRIYFTVNKSVMLHGVQHFGSDGGECAVSTEVKNSTDGSILVKQSGSYFSEKAETDAYYGFDVGFDRPISLMKNKEYELVSLIKGPVSWFGGEGQETMEFHGVQFTFRSPDNITITNGTSIRQASFLLF